MTLKGLTASASLWQVDTPVPNMLATVGYVFNAVSVDGDFGLFSKAGNGNFDDVTVNTDDPVFLDSLVAASPPPSADAGGEAIDAPALAGVVDEAIARWVASGLVDEAGRALLESVTFSVADLSGLLLGLTTDTTVTLDIDAAGFGWFVDASLADDCEFAPDGEGNLTATPGSEAEGRMDLLTVVMHELGHVLGFADGSQLAGGVMNETLEAGTRLVPVAATPAAQDTVTVAAAPDEQVVAAPQSTVAELQTGGGTGTAGVASEDPVATVEITDQAAAPAATSTETETATATEASAAADESEQPASTETVQSTATNSGAPEPNAPDSSAAQASAPASTATQDASTDDSSASGNVSGDPLAALPAEDANSSQADQVPGSNGKGRGRS